MSVLRSRGLAAAVFTVSVLGTAGVALGGAATASAAPTTRYVATTGTDAPRLHVGSAPCRSVQYAIDESDPGDTVHIGPGTYHESVRISSTVTLLGSGATGSAATVVDGFDGDVSVTVDGTDTDSAVAVVLRDVAVDGNSDAGGVVVRGSAASLAVIDSSVSNNDDDGIDSAGAKVTVENSTVDGNDGNGISVAPAPAIVKELRAAAAGAADLLTVTGSSVSANSNEGVDVAVAGGSATIDGSVVNRNADGGVVVEAGRLAVASSLLDANVGAAVVVDSSTAQVSVTDSTVADTTAFPGERGGIAFGAGLITFGGALDVADSTVTHNTGQGLLGLAGAITLSQSTVTATRAAADGLPSAGVAVTTGLTLDVRRAAATSRTRFRPFAKAAVAPTTGTVAVRGSIVAAQAAGVADCVGTPADAGYNLSSDAANSCGFTASAHDVVKHDPRLGALGDNGGPTPTQAPRKGSPAIDAVAPGAAGCVSGATDQRGVARPQPAGGRCDIGAVELAAKAIVVAPGALPHGTVGEAYRVTLTATGGQFPQYAWSLAPGSHLPGGLTLTSGGLLSGTPTTAGTYTVTVSVNDPVLKTYTLVIDAAAGPNGAGDEPIAATGVHSAALVAWGVGALLLGALLLLAGVPARRIGRHRSA